MYDNGKVLQYNALRCHSAIVSIDWNEFRKEKNEFRKEKNGFRKEKTVF